MSIWTKTRLRAFKRSPAADDTILDRSFEDDNDDDDDDDDHDLHRERERRHADLERQCREFLSRRAAKAQEARSRWGLASASVASTSSSSTASYFTLDSTGSSDSSEDTDEGLGRSLSEESACSGHAHPGSVPPLQVKLNLLRVQLLDLVAADNALLSQLVNISGAIAGIGAGKSSPGEVSDGEGLRELSAWRAVIRETKDHEEDDRDHVDEQQLINDLLDEALDLSVSDVDDDNVESPKSLRSSASKESSVDDRSRKCIIRSQSVAAAKPLETASGVGPLQRQRVSFPATAKNRRKKSEPALPLATCTLPASVARANREKKRSLALSRERLPPPPPPPDTPIATPSSRTSLTSLPHAHSSDQIHAEVVSVRGRLVAPERKLSTVTPPEPLPLALPIPLPMRTTVRVLANGSSSVVQAGMPVPAVRTSVQARAGAPTSIKARTTTISIPASASVPASTSTPVRVSGLHSRSVLHSKQASVDSGVGAGTTSTSATSDSE